MGRIFKDFREATNEIKRDLAEMGISVHPQTYQDKFVGNDPNFSTFELQNYMYSVSSPLVTDLSPTQPWADREFIERTAQDPINPGEAWKTREDVWKQFLTPEGKFAYTYNERILGRGEFDQIDLILDRIQEDPDSRQLFLSIWAPDDITRMGGISRIPCSLGYQFLVRGGKLNMTYLQRSSDFATHFVNDVYLAFQLQLLMSILSKFEVGIFTHWIGSLHIFKKDAEGVF